jgi:peptide/nickel transport system substrate-binding protein
MTGLPTRFKLTGKLFILLAISLTVVLAACSSGGGSTAKTTPTPKTTTLRVDPAPGGPNPDLFNPYFDTNQGSDFGSQGLLYESLYFTNLYNGQTLPWLASNYSYSTDLKTLTFTLNPKIKWSDGQPLTSQDVVFTFNLMKKYPDLDQNSVWATLLSGVTAPDNETVAFTLQHPDSTALYRIGTQQFIVPQHIWSSVSGDPAKFANDKSPVGTGPYLLSSWNAQLITYKANPNYWGTQPQVKEIQVPSVKDNTTAITDMITGQLDWMGTGWNPTLDPSFSGKDPAHNHTWFAASNTVMLYLNLQKAPFNNLNVRKAISAAINRDQLPQGVAEYAKAANPSGVITPTLSSWIAPSLQNATFSYSISQAKSYLQQAGMKMGSDGYFQYQGKDFAFPLDVVNGWSDWQQDIAYIQKDLQAAGINATINTQSGYTPYYTAISTGSYDAAISWTNSGPTPYYPFQALLSSANSAVAGKAVGGTNFERWDATTSNGFSAKVDQYLLQYEESSDVTAQKTAIGNIEQVMATQLPAIPLTVNVYWDEYTTTNWTGWPNASSPYDAGAPYLSPDSEYVILHLTPAS